MIRIKALASLVENDAKIIDIGTDHALLPIYLYLNKITKNIVASDISNLALEYARANLIKYNLEDKIKLVLSDGFKNLDEKFDIAVISGMGTDTIKKILDYKDLPRKLIISSHKNVSSLRSYMQSIEYKLIKEVVVKKRNKFYNIIKYEKGIDNLSKLDILIGKSNNLEYREYLLNKYKKIYEKSCDKKYLEYIKLIEKSLV